MLLCPLHLKNRSIILDNNNYVTNRKDCIIYTLNESQRIEFEAEAA